MANISEIESQIEQTKLALKSLEAQLAAEKSGGRQTTKGSQRNVGGEDEGAPSPEEAASAMSEAKEEEMSFSDRVNQRMSAPEESPAEEVASEEAAPMVKKVMVGIAMDAEENDSSVSMEDLFNTVYDKPYDANSAMDADKMRQMKDAMEDPRVKRMAMEEPEKFALFMYGRRSV